MISQFKQGLDQIIEQERKSQETCDMALKEKFVYFLY
jgi:hypothetical protein